MKRMLVGLVLLLSACAHLPAIQPLDGYGPDAAIMDCRSHFPQGRWQLVHTIGARFYGGRQAAFTGAVVLSTPDRSIHCVLMTLEGMVLFEADDDGRTTTVHRAFGPFDNPSFARGVMADIRFLFFRPEGDLIAAGTAADGSRVCRFEATDRTVVDLAMSADGSWRMQQYDAGGNTVRRVTADAVDSRGISPRMAINAGSGYDLSLHLVEAVGLS